MADYEAAEKFILAYLKENLKKDLSYHGIHHTLEVISCAVEIAKAENLDEKNTKLLSVAACLHDVGFTKTYVGHEDIGYSMAKEWLPQFGFSDAEIKTIGGMINATRIPQEPRSPAEKIIADADLDYLGRDDFYSIGKTLYEEMKIYRSVKDEKEWNTIQLKFLKAHHYHTDFSIQHRGEKKRQHLKEIEHLVNNN
jgi:uncharacterized protein